ncbi:MAG: hypothetical protein MZW92_56045 [Comamonadaceae bacterium]|nr:hypothetical protein [Comamonadaceae bacterium]
MVLLRRQLPGVRGRQEEAPGRGRRAAQARALQADPLRSRGWTGGAARPGSCCLPAAGARGACGRAGAGNENVDDATRDTPAAGRRRRGARGLHAGAREQPMSGYAEAELVYCRTRRRPDCCSTLAVQPRRRACSAGPAAVSRWRPTPQALARDAADARRDRRRGAGRRTCARAGVPPERAGDRRSSSRRPGPPLAASLAALQRQQHAGRPGLRLGAAAGRTGAPRATAMPRACRSCRRSARLADEAARSDEIAAAAAEAPRRRRRPGAGALARGPDAARRRRSPPWSTTSLYRVGEWVPAGAPVVALLPPAR